jgi:hypothetical protein
MGTRKEQSKEERMRRLLGIWYEDLLAQCVGDTEQLVLYTTLLDALKDMIEDREDGMREWRIRKDGVIEFD